MGQRANYIIIDSDKQTIHYNHWRANCIASDLYLGEERFINFVRGCQIDGEIMNEPWIEGCVIIDIPKRELHFWSLEFGQTSVIAVYLEELQNKWKGWSINLLSNRMYDIEKVLGVEYVSQQEIPLLTHYTRDEVVNDKVDKWPTALVLIQNKNGLFTTKTGSLNIDGILHFGESIVELLLEKSQCELLTEEDEDDEIYECIVLDVVNKAIIIDKSEYGLWEQVSKGWQGYTFTMGDFGYVGVLRLAQIDTDRVCMPLEKAREGFLAMVRYRDGSNPQKMANLLLQGDQEIIFNPNFFDNVKPQKTITEKVKIGINKVFGRK